ncbi:hypothetical protein BJF79_04825 [Actinomadura sp. CNU-125]|uniref:hypothetical protein n=1 Tax=Actinomadura sp. CNU-125 TaxID=1904961 RepID=UPI00095FB241|nr:hypothetical protein [Actinomadura sp. CNU-125]OLT11206.1 hypothetical protein BJF79_04825 [Actinomadura sp. CNU-125]
MLSLEGNYRLVALTLGALAVAALACSAGAAAGTLRARDTKNVNIADVRRYWKGHLERTEKGGGYSDAWHTAALQRQFAEMLLHGVKEEESPLQSMRQDADSRGRWFSWAVFLTLAALLLILAITVTTTVGNLDEQRAAPAAAAGSCTEDA